MKYKILIVEDEKLIARVFKKKIERFSGFAVDIANGGKIGLKMMQETRYNLVLLDLIMPDIDGIAVLETLKEDPVKYFFVPVIVLSNLSNEESGLRVKELGAVKFLEKSNIKTVNLIKTIKVYAQR